VGILLRQAEERPHRKAPPAGAGDIWTWVALDADTKLVASFYVGGRDGEAALDFVSDLAPRLANRVQITSDGHRAYLDAIEDGQPAHDPPHQRLLKKGCEPRAYDGDLLHALQFRSTLKITPAMAASVTPKLWEMSDMVKVLEDWETLLT
jgi:hypothetical protein